MVLEDKLKETIREGKWSFHCSSTSADDLTRKQYPGLPWDQFPDRQGTIEYITIISQDPSERHGSVYLSTSGKKLVTISEKELYEGAKGSLEEVPKEILEATKKALTKDGHIYGPQVKELIDESYKPNNRNNH